MTTPAAVIFGCEGLRLTDWERGFFREVQPHGFIVFARNIDTPEQIRHLTAEMRESVGRNAPVLVDQEGGRVRRLRPPHWSDVPSAARLAEVGQKAIRTAAALTAAELLDVGIDVNCAPCLDLAHPEGHAAIGDRAFGAVAETVAADGRAYWETLLACGVMPVVKHMPGHGRARVDSHESLPTIETDLETLDRSDFLPFSENRDAPWGMTGHLVFRACDPDLPVTLSPTAIAEIIRGRLGFDGVLVSDDLSMGALGGGMQERTRMALAAGCDLALHCNGKRDEMIAVAEGGRPLDGAAQRRLTAAEARLGQPDKADRQALIDELTALLSNAAARLQTAAGVGV